MGLFLKTIDYRLTQTEQLVHGTVIGTIGCLIEMTNVVLCKSRQRITRSISLQRMHVSGIGLYPLQLEAFFPGLRMDMMIVHYHILGSLPLFQEVLKMLSK